LAEVKVNFKVKIKINVNVNVTVEDAAEARVLADGGLRGRDRCERGWPRNDGRKQRPELAHVQLARNQAGRRGVVGGMTRKVGRPLLLLAGAVAPVLYLSACASASHVAIPAAAQTVTLSLDYGGNAGDRKPPAPVTVTGSAKVSEVAGLVAGQPPAPPGPVNCPDSDGEALKLVFRAGPGGPAVATAVLSLDGCEFTELAVGAKDHALGQYASGRSMAARVLQVAGVAWKLPPFQWPVG